MSFLSLRISITSLKLFPLSTMPEGVVYGRHSPNYETLDEDWPPASPAVQLSSSTMAHSSNCTKKYPMAPEGATQCIRLLL